MIYSYKDLHYDVLNIGKQEVWMGKETLLSIMDTTKCDFVSANLLDVKTRKPFAKPYVIKDYGNLRVGVLGLLNEMDFPKGSSMLDSTVFEVSSHFEAAKKYVPLLAKKCDAVVVLCELSSTSLDTFCLQIPGMDLVISSGALKSGEAMTMIGKTRVVGTGSSGYSGHYATLELNPSWKDSVAVTNFTDYLTDNYEEKNVWADRLTAFNQNPPPARVPAAKPSTATSVSPVKPGGPAVNPSVSPVAPSPSPNTSATPETKKVG